MNFSVNPLFPVTLALQIQANQAFLKMKKALEKVVLWG
jgi:hypothetical protein